MRERIKRFTRPLTLPSGNDCICWGAARRLLYNLIVLPAFAVRVGLSLILAGQQVLTRPGLAVSVMAVVFVFGSNFGYTLGWVSELMWTAGQTSITRPYRPLMFWFGTGLTLLICLAPLCGVAFLALTGALQ